MLSKIEIDGYRGLKHLSLSDLTKFNIIVGPNDSGKTTLLEALFLHCAPLNFRAIFTNITIRTGGFILNVDYIMEQLKWLFTNPGNMNELNMTISGVWNNYNRKTTLSLQRGGFHDGILTGVPLERETDYRAIFPGQAALPSFTIPQMGSTSGTISSAEVKMEKGFIIGSLLATFESDKQRLVEDRLELATDGKLDLGNMPIIKNDINASILDAQVHRAPNVSLEAHTIATKTGLSKKCLGLLQKIEPELKEIQILMSGAAPQLYVDHEKLGMIPMSVFGDGFKRMHLMTTQLAQCENGILLLDDFDVGIYTLMFPSLSDWMIETAKELNVQIFLTTHNLESIDTIVESEHYSSNDFSLFRIKKDKDKVVCKKMAGDQLKRIREELGQDVR